MRLSSVLILCSYGIAGVSLLAQTSVTTQHNDIGRTGQNVAETVLTPSNVTASTFGKLFSLPVDGQVYAQPLYLPSVKIGGFARRVVYVATEHDSVFAFDAATGAQVWKASMLDLAHGAAPGATPDPESDTGCGDISALNGANEYGITGTPVIDPASGTLYVVAKTYEGTYPVLRLHALDVASGAEKFGGPVVISASVNGSGSGSSGGVLKFDPKWEDQRAGLLLLKGTVYIAFGSQCDASAGHGWTLGYNASTLVQTSSVWAGGVGLAADVQNGAGRIFPVTGNGTFDATSLGTNGNGSLALASTLTPDNQSLSSSASSDTGSDGVLVLPDQTGTNQHLLLELGKSGAMYLVNGDGTSANSNIVQTVTASSALSGQPAYWNGNVYIWPSAGKLTQYSLTNGVLSASPVSASAQSNLNGSTPSVSANGTSDGIVWSIDWSQTPGVLYAHSASNVATLLWSSAQKTTRDSLGTPVKFVVPTIADGQVFAPANNQVEVYGLLPGSAPNFSLAVFPAAVNVVPGSSATTRITLTPVNGFTGKLTFSAGNLPAGVSASFSSGVLNTYTLTLTASSDTALSSAPGPISITASSGLLSYTLSLPVNVSNTAATPANISTYSNVVSSAYYLSPVAGGGIDAKGYAYSANLLGRSLYANGVPFTFGTPGSANGAANTTIALPPGSFTTLNLLGTALNGNQTSQSFVVNYTDGTKTTFVQSMSEWSSPQNYTGENIALPMAYRINSGGAADNHAYNLYAYSFVLNSAKSVQSLVLPANRNVVVLAATLSGVGTADATSQDVTFNAIGTQTASQGGNATTTVASPRVVSQALAASVSPYLPVSLSSNFNVYGIFNNGIRPTHNGFDNDGNAYSGNLLGTSATWSGIPFNFGPSGALSAVANTTIPLPAGTYQSISLLAAGANGNHANQSFVVTYTDGTRTTFVQSVSDWATPQNYSAEARAVTTAYRVTPTGSTQNGPFYLYGYTFALNGGKTVQSIALPATRNVVVLGVTLFRGQSVTVNVPTGVSFTLNGVTYTGTQTVLLPAGTYTLATTTPQSLGTGSRAVFGSWSDGGALSHSITVGSAALTITGNFTTQYQLTTAAGTGGTVSPASGTFYNAATVVPVVATPNPGYVFSSWTGPVASATSASTSVTMSAAESVTANFVASRNVTVNVPTGVSFTLNGVTYTGTQALSLPAGTYTLATTTPQSLGTGSRAVFGTWSDGGAISHSITVAATPLTITGNFTTQYQLTTVAGTGGTVLPASGTFYNSGTTVPIVATPNTGYVFSSWTGPVASATSASTTVAMSAPQTVTANFAATQGVTVNVPAGVSFTLNGVTYTGTKTVSLAPGSYTLSTTTPQSLGTGSQAVFGSWSDGGSISHSITVTSSPLAITGTFKTQYQLTTIAGTGGTVTPASGTFYDSGTVVPVVATPNANYVFSSWTGAVASATSASTTVTMSAAQTVTANFAANQGVTVNVPSGVSFTLNGVTYTGSKTVSLAPGTYTLSTTSPQSLGTGSQAVFASWSDGGAQSHSITVSAAALAITGTFTTQYQLTTVAGTGGTVSPASGTFYNSGTAVPIVATPNTGYVFSSWTGPVASATSASTTVAMSAPQTVTANFAATQGVTVNVPAGVSFTLNGVTYTGTKTVSLAPGSYTLSTTTPQSLGTGSQAVFGSWSDGGSISHSITVTSSPLAITGTFKTQYQLTTIAGTGGTVTPASGTFYDSGTVVPVVATPNANYVFSSWTGAVASATSASTTVAMSAPQTVTANFAALQGVTVNAPSGVSFTLNGVTYTGSKTVSLAPGTYTLSTTSPQSLGTGSQAVFTSWSDGGAQAHSITVGSAPLTITGTYKTQYQLTTIAGTGGTVSPASGTFYDANSAASVVATPNSGYVFSSWTGPVASASSASTTVPMNTAQTVTANFAPYQGVTVNVPAGLSFSLNGATYMGTQTVSLAPGTYTLSTTSPQSLGTGSQAVFVSWSDGGAQSHPITVASAPLTITGNFKTQYQLTTVASTGGTVSPASGAFYDSGTAVQVVATPNASYAFSSWTGAVASATSASTTVTMSVAQTVTANFAPYQGVTVNVPAGLSFSLNGATYTGTQTVSLAPGTYTLATSSPQPLGTGSQAVFVSWSDGGGLSHSITVASASLTVTGTFKTQYQLTTIAGTGGTVSPASGAFYDSGTVVPVVATPAATYLFTGWSGPVASASSASTSLTITGPVAVTASFSNITTVTVGANIAGLSFSVDGTTYSAIQTFAWVNGSSHTLAITSPQSTNGVYYGFTQWSDGTSGLTDTVTVGPTTTSYTANFQALTPLLTAPPASLTMRNDSDGFVGMQFTTGSTPLNVISLGRIYLAGNSQTHIVKLVNATNGFDVPNASVSLTMTPGLVNSYQYATLATPVVLAPNTSYYLVSQEFNGGDNWYEFAAVSANPAVTVNGPIYQASVGAYVLLVPGAQSFVPPSMLFSGVQTSAPAVTITSPTNGATVQGTIQLAATAVANNPGATIASVQFLLNGNNFGAPLTAPPYTLPLDTTTLTKVNNTLSVTATDSTGATGAATPVSFSVGSSTVVPFITGTPSSGLRTDYAGFVGFQFTTGATPITVTQLGRWVVAGNSGTHIVKLVDATGVDLLNGSVTLSLAGAPSGQYVYAALLSPITLSANTTYYLMTQETVGGDSFNDVGPITANAIGTVNAAYYQQTNGVYAPLTGYASSLGNPNFLFSTGATTMPPPPTVVVTVPISGSTVSNTVQLSATATPATGLTISGVQFRVNGSNVGPLLTSAPYNYSLDTTKLANGAAIITAVATDSTGQTGTSSSVVLNVSNVTVTTIAFVTSTPTGTQRNDFSGFVGMQFTTGSMPIVVSQLGRWTVSGNSGSHVVKLVQADGTDLPGGAVTLNLATATAGQYNYAALASPLTLPANTTYYLVSQEALGGDMWYDASLVTVSSGAAANAPAYQYNGAYTLVTPVGGSYVPPNFLYSVVSAPPPPPPTVTITSPTVGTVSGSITLAATATPATGLTIAKVQFQLNGNNVSSPLDTTTLANGTYTLIAIATDSLGSVGASAGVVITVSNPVYSPLITGAPAGGLRNDYAGFVGMQFTVGNTPLTVNQLGRWVVSGNNATHIVKLVDGFTGADVAGASVTVNMSGALSGQYVYAPLPSPVILPPSHTYYLVSEETLGGDQWYGDAPVTVNVAVAATVNGPEYQEANSSYQLLYNGVASYGTVNLLGSSN